MEVIYENLTNNVEKVVNYHANKKIYAVVKSDAYNHGVKNVVPIMIKCGISNFCVNSISEVIELRKISKAINILLLGRISEDECKLYIDNDVTVSLSNKNDYKIIISNQLKYQLCVNTGMNRYGLTIDDAYSIIKNRDNLIKGVYSHLGSSDVRDKRYYKQSRLFRDLINKFELSNLDIHISNSCDSLNTENTYNSVRIGMLFYNGIENNLNLLNTVSIAGKIININLVNKNDYIGYYKVKKLNKSKLIGIVNIGYETGILNIYKIKYVIINGKKYKIVGKLCMNNMFIEVDYDIKIGDTVEVIGEFNNVNSISKISKISAYEILMNFKK